MSLEQLEKNFNSDDKQLISQLIYNHKELLDKWIGCFLYDEESRSYEQQKKYWIFQVL